MKTVYDPDHKTALIKVGDRCPGASTFGNTEHAFWFGLHEDAEAMGTPVELDSLPVRDSQAMVVIAQEVRFVRQSEDAERVNGG